MNVRRSDRLIRSALLSRNRKGDFERNLPMSSKEIVAKVDQTHDRERLDNWENDGGASDSVTRE